MRILIVGFSESIHVARWINDIDIESHEVFLFPSVDNGITNDQLKNATVFHSFYGNFGRKKNVRTKGIYVFSHFAAIAIRMFVKRFWPDLQVQRLKKVIKKIKPDIIHSMELQHSGYLVEQVKSGWNGNFPLWVVTNWGSDIYLFGQLPEHAEKIRKVLTSCDYYSCECQRDIKLGRNLGFSKTPLPVFPNSGGFDLAKIKRLRDKMTPSKRKTIVVKGYQGWAGRAQVALHALDLAGEVIRGYRLVIYSIQPNTGVEIAAQLLAKKYNLELILVPLNSSHEQILKFMSEARISIGLSISDAISTMVLEALVMGSFPIQSDTSCANEWIEHSKTGMIVPAEDPQVIKKAIIESLTNDAMVNKAAKENWRTALQRLDKKIIKEKIGNFYKEVGNMKKDKVFVTGVYGSGKTTFVKKYAKENHLRYFPFDKIFNYSRKNNQSSEILNSLPDSFVMDAIPIDEKDSWADFIRYEKKRDDIMVVCVYCPSFATWLKRVGKRAVHYKDFKGALKHVAKKVLKKKILPVNIETLSADYRNFFKGTLKSLKKFKTVKFYDSIANEYTTLAEMLKRIKFDTFEFQDYLQGQPQGYDKYYQDIEVIDLKGYSESYKTWNIIKKLVVWKGKKVVDLGCSHGYFSFKAEGAGAKVTGLEKSASVLKTTKWIAKLSRSKAKFFQWEGGKPIPKSDIILCLNVLHHFPDPHKVLQMMDCKRAIFEINKKDMPIVAEDLRIIKKVRSQRTKRIILLCETKKHKK